jgi:hypothetical protein
MNTRDGVKSCQKSRRYRHKNQIIIRSPTEHTRRFRSAVSVRHTTGRSYIRQVLESEAHKSPVQQIQSVAQTCTQRPCRDTTLRNGDGLTDVSVCESYNTRNTVTMVSQRRQQHVAYVLLVSPYMPRSGHQPQDSTHLGIYAGLLNELFML